MTFPNVEIMPDERMIVWASGLNRTTATSPLHTNFTLSASGGTAHPPAFGCHRALPICQLPSQTANVSFGRDEWDAAIVPTQTGFYKKPTPGDRNNYSGTGVSGKVAVDVSSRAYTGNLTVTLSQAVPNSAP